MEWCWGEREGNVMETPGYWLVEINGQGAIPWDGERGERSKSTPTPPHSAGRQNPAQPHQLSYSQASYSTSLSLRNGKNKSKRGILEPSFQFFWNLKDPHNLQKVSRTQTSSECALCKCIGICCVSTPISEGKRLSNRAEVIFPKRESQWVRRCLRGNVHLLKHFGGHFGKNVTKVNIHISLIQQSHC